MKSASRFYRFITENNIDEDLADILHDRIFRSSVDSYLSADLIAVESELKNMYILEILDRLADAGFIEKLPTICHNCGMELPTSLEEHRCPECDATINLTSENSYKVIGVNNEKESSMITKSVRDERLLKRLMESWEENGEIYYMMFDLVDSEEILDDLGNEEYNVLLDTVRNVWELRVVSNCKRHVWFLGEVGDLYKVVLSDWDDVHRLVDSFANELSHNEKFKYFDEKSSQKIPRYKGMVGVLREIQNKEGQHIKKEAVFKKTLGGVYDFNMKEIHQLYRMEGALKNYKDNYYSTDFRMAFWYFNKAIEKVKETYINAKNIKPFNLKVGKKSYGDGLLKIYFDNKKEFVSNSNEV